MNVGVIPARLHSTRFPRKILALIEDKPMVVQVYERAKQAGALQKVIVAIDSEETQRALEPFDLPTTITDPALLSGTDRVAAVVRDLEAEIVVNIQADEPFLDPRIIDRMVLAFTTPNVQIVTAASTDLTPEDIFNPNVVKVLLDEKQQAVAFRRKPEDWEVGGYYRHLGLYAFRKAVLLKFTSLSPTVNERQQRLEQLRALDHGIPIFTILTDFPYRGVDTPEDLQTLFAKKKELSA